MKENNLVNDFSAVNDAIGTIVVQFSDKLSLEVAQSNPKFTLIEGDIRDRETCMKAVEDCGYVLHQTALGYVPRFINEPITNNEVYVVSFLNMLVAASEACYLCSKQLHLWGF